MNDFRESDLLATQLDLIDLSKSENNMQESLLLSDTAETVNQTGNQASMASTMSQRGGFCVKEHEEQLESLQKENFNLKLRIYFLEKNNPNIPEDTDSILQQNIDLRVENETLRKEVDSRGDLVKQAHVALDLVENEKDKQQMNYEQLLEQLNQKIESLETENFSLQQQALKETQDKTNLNNETGYAEFFGAMESKSAETERQLIEMTQQIENLQQKLDEMATMKNDVESRNKSLTERVAKLQFEKDELQDQIVNMQNSSCNLVIIKKLTIST